MKKRSKKAQFFLIFAVIIGILILGASFLFNSIEKQEKDFFLEFNNYCSNYREETFKIQEQMIGDSNQNICGELKDYSEDFYKLIKNKGDVIELGFIFGNSTDESNQELCKFNNPNIDFISLDQNQFIFKLKVQKGENIYICE